MNCLNEEDDQEAEAVAAEALEDVRSSRQKHLSSQGAFSSRRADSLGSSDIFIQFGGSGGVCAGFVGSFEASSSFGSSMILLAFSEFVKVVLSC